MVDCSRFSGERPKRERLVRDQRRDIHINLIPRLTQRKNILTLMVHNDLTTNFSLVDCGYVLYVLDRVVMRPGLEVRVVLLGEDAGERGVHVVDGSSCDQFLLCLDVVLELDVSVGFVAVGAVYGVAEDVAVEPFGVVEGDVECELLFAVLLPDSHVAELFDLFGVEFISGCDLRFVCFKDIISEVVWLRLGKVVMGSDGHVEIWLMGGPFDIEDRGFSDDVDM